MERLTLKQTPQARHPCSTELHTVFSVWLVRLAEAAASGNCQNLCCPDHAAAPRRTCVSCRRPVVEARLRSCGQQAGGGCQHSRLQHGSPVGGGPSGQRYCRTGGDGGRSDCRRGKGGRSQALLISGTSALLWP